MFLLLNFGCKREDITDTDNEIIGYRIEGTVKDRLGMPVDSVKIKVFFNYDLVDYDTDPNNYFVITNRQDINVFQVYDSDDSLVRNLYTSTLPVDTIMVSWNFKDDAKNDVPVGLYHIKHFVNGNVRKSVPVIVDGTITAFTDAAGFFVIPNKRLPIGFYPVPIYNHDTTFFYGNHVIAEDCDLIAYTRSSTYQEAYVKLVKNKIAQVQIIMP